MTHNTKSMGKILAHAFSIVALSACVKTREITLPQEKDSLVINCLFNPDSSWMVNVSATQPVTNTSIKFALINNATIHLYENQTYVGAFTNAGKGNYTLHSKPKVGKQYKITVSAPGYEAVYAEDSIPASAGTILNAAIHTNETITTTDNSPPYVSYEYHPVDMQLKDNALGDNYYRVNIYRALTDTAQLRAIDNFLGVSSMYGYYYIGSKDQTLNTVANGRRFLLFSNHYFKNQSKNIIARTSTYIYTTIYAYADSTTKFHEYGDFITCPAPHFLPKINYDLYIELRTISRTYYNYCYSLRVQGQTVSDPFAEFKNVYTNVKGGYGIFAGYQITRKKAD